MNEYKYEYECPDGRYTLKNGKYLNAKETVDELHNLQFSLRLSRMMLIANKVHSPKAFELIDEALGLDIDEED